MLEARKVSDFRFKIAFRMRAIACAKLTIFNRCIFYIENNGVI